MQREKIRNFSIISHVDHGKSTLSDRILELTKAVDPRQMREQFLDSMDLERERGITIKAQNVNVYWKGFELNLIDTPGHVDFNYEVSRSLAACEGVVLLVDASQGIQAQTLANCYLAIERNLEVIAVLNKIDLPNADVNKVADEINEILGIKREEILKISAKTGEGVDQLLDTILDKIPPPRESSQDKLSALIFDSYFDQYRGVVASIRVFDGTIRVNDKIKMFRSKESYEVSELGVRTPFAKSVDELTVGEVGYMIASIKDVALARPGETVTHYDDPVEKPLEGYKPSKAMVYCGLYPIEGDDFEALKDALEKLRLNDAGFNFEPETSQALGFGFRCGFSGLLHMEIIKERLEREFNLGLIASAPSVSYEVDLKDGTKLFIENPNDMPETNKLLEIKEPILKVNIITPSAYVGAVMELCQTRRGEFCSMNYLSKDRAELEYEIPLAEVVVDFFDALKSRTKGYGSLDYEETGYKASKLVKVDILVNGVCVDAFSAICHKEKAEYFARKMVTKLRELIPRQLFDVPIQAAINNKVVARETIKAKRKDVIAKCYGGDVTRKRKLLEKQKEGKKKMKSIGRVEIPQEAFISALSLDDGH
jgi:GTP-binding protein LepA